MAKIVRRLKTLIGSPQNIPYLVFLRLGSQFGYRYAHMLRAHALPPETINIYPTDKCNLKCSMCFERFRARKPEMTTEEWLRIINQIRKFHPRIHLSGGEPLLYPGIDQLIAYIKRNGLFLTITTNGTYLSKYAEQIIKYRVNRIQVSIDGPKDIHDSIRGVKGTYERIFNGLAKIKTMKKNSLLPVIRINSMINFSSEAAMHEVIEFGCKIGAESIQFLHPLFVDTHALANHKVIIEEQLNRSLDYWRNADLSSDRPTDLRQLHTMLNRIKKKYKIPIDIFPPFTYTQTESYYNIQRDFYKTINSRCRAMWHTATILPSGDLESCPDYVIGNCKKNDFLVLWNSEKMKILRRRIKQRNFFPVCRACCFFYF